MPELASRLPCPVCLGTVMEKVRLGPGGGVEVDHCRRCGGLWLEKGEVQQLRSVPRGELSGRLRADRTDTLIRCHDCHAPIDRGDERCAACGAANVLDCPDCGSAMTPRAHASMRLDVCRRCEGVWFDQHEIESIWGAALDRSLQRRKLSRTGVAGEVADGAGDVLLNTLFFAPDLLFYGAYAAGNVASASLEALSRTPEALGAAPEVAAGAFEAVGEAAGSVFEVIVEIVSGIFDSF